MIFDWEVFRAVRLVVKRPFFLLVICHGRLLNKSVCRHDSEDGLLSCYMYQPLLRLGRLLYVFPGLRLRVCMCASVKASDHVFERTMCLWWYKTPFKIFFATPPYP